MCEISASAGAHLAWWAEAEAKGEKARPDVVTRLELFLLPGRGALKNCEAGMHLRVSIVQNHLQPCRRWIRKGEQSQALSRVHG